jgi:hypothetical protein
MSEVPSEMIFHRGTSRLFEAVWVTVHLTDAMAIASSVVIDKLDIKKEDQSIALGCTTHKCEIVLPIVSPTRTVVINHRIDTIIIKFRAPSELLGHNVTEYAGLHHKVLSLVYLRFYEQHRPYLQLDHGRDTKAWPPLFQFAWAIRNAITHHGGHINFENPNYPEVHWKTLS